MIHAFADFPASGSLHEGWWLPSRDYAALWNNYALNAKGKLADPGK